MSVSTFLQWLASLIGPLFANAATDAEAFFAAFITSIAQNGGALLMDSATNAVAAAEREGGSGQHKFDAAQTAIIGTLTNAGIPIAVNAVNAAIEAAVAQMRANAAHPAELQTAVAAEAPTATDTAASEAEPARAHGG